MQGCKKYRRAYKVTLLTIIITLMILPAGVKAENIPPGYKLVAENENLSLYLKKENLALKIKDKRSGYIWSSIIDDLVSGENNQSWANFMQSGLALEYYEQQKTKPYRTDLLSAKNKEVSVTINEDGFQATINFKDIKIGFTFYAWLEGRELVVSLPEESITESEKYKLGAIYIYPFLGATRKDEVSGYMFIPDGCGGLINFDDNQDKFKRPYTARIYGKNAGIEEIKHEEEINPPHQVKLPVYGIVHGVNKNALFSIIEKGKYNAQILAYPNGATTQYNWITAKYIYRESYLQPTSKSMGGVVVFEKKKKIEDLQTRYFFLNGEKANYVGMARNYQSYLEEKGVFEKQKVEEKNIPVRLDILGAESENGLFFKRIIPMTTVSQLETIVDELKENGIKDMLLVYKGWNKGGYSGTKPYLITYEKALGTEKEFQRFSSKLEAMDIPLYFYDDYSIGFANSKRFSPRASAVRGINKRVIEVMTEKKVYPRYYYLTAERTAEIIEENRDKYIKKGIDRVAIDSTGRLVFSEMRGDKKRYRIDTASTYLKAIGKLDKKLTSIAMYAPNDYMLKYTDSYFDIPISSSQFVYLDEVVPFFQILLKGYINYFSPYVNFFANQQEGLLKLIEYGAYPSYIITYESSYKLKYTNSDNIFSSSYKDWRDEIISQYQTLNKALSKVNGATIKDRQMLADAVVKVSYDNNIDIVVNYQQVDYVYKGETIPAKGFKVIEVKE